MYVLGMGYVYVEVCTMVQVWHLATTLQSQFFPRPRESQAWSSDNQVCQSTPSPSEPRNEMLKLALKLCKNHMELNPIKEFIILLAIYY